MCHLAVKCIELYNHEVSRSCSYAKEVLILVHNMI